ncbi:MAG: MMPL family transporter [Bacteroidetes bacterium]|nr:MMPL family transporter [Bacteroidota bacterium]
MHSFINIHNFISKGKYVFAILLLAVIALVSHYALRLELEEDISAIIPKDERLGNINEVISGAKVADQLIFMFSTKEGQENPYLLISTADKFIEELLADTLYIKSVKFRTESDEFQSLYNFIYNNLPLFLNDEDYETISEKLSTQSIEAEIENNFRTLISPVGFVTKEYILKDPLHLVPIALKKLESFQLDGNFHLYNSCIFTKDNSTLLIFVEPVFQANNTKANRTLISNIDDLTEKFNESNSEISIDYYGGTAVAVANASRLKSDIIFTVSFAMILLSILFFFVFRKIRYIILMFFPIVLGILISLALLVVIEGTVSAIALGVGAVLIGISIDYSLHAFTHFRSSGSVIHTLKSISKPIMMSSISTALAFLCLFIVKSKALNQLGMFSAMSIVATALIVLIVVPFFLKEKNQPEQKPNKVKILEKIAEYNFDKNKKLIYLILALSVVFIFTSSRLGFNSDLASLNYQPDKLEKAEKKLKSISSEAFSAVYFINQGNSLDEALNRSEKTIEQLTSFKNDSIISDISSISGLLISEENQKQKIEKWEEFWDKTKKDELRENLINAGNKFKFKSSTFYNFYSLLDKKFETVDIKELEVVFESFTGNYLSENNGIYSVISIAKVEQNNKDILFRKIDAGNDVLIYDNQYYINKFLDILKEDFNLLVVLSMSLIFLILLISYGRIEIAIISFIPIALSWIWTIGLMGLFGIKFNIFNIIVTTFVFGLGVDYSIFIVSGLIARYKYGNVSLQPYKMSVLLSAITTITSFGVLFFAQHPVLKSIAIVSIIGISSVILITFTLLPKMFHYLVENKRSYRTIPITFYNLTVSINALIFFLIGTLGLTAIMPVLISLPIKTKHKKKFVHWMICNCNWVIITANHGVRRKFINKEKLDFSKPSVIISNHQSYLDLIYLLRLNPKMIAFTNSWVYNSFFFGKIIRFADFVPVFQGLDENFEKLKKKIDEGYSLLVFPEGTRTPDGNISRFHQGAFYVADKLNIDVQPVMIHGIFECIPKHEFYLKAGKIHMKIFDRIKPVHINEEAGETHKEQAKEMTRFYREEMKNLKQEVETPRYFKRKLIAQYIYKGPVLEWYMKAKVRSENYYEFFNDVIPRDASIVDVGCGYGFLSLMLHYISNDRKITGIDYDEEKISVAQNIPNKTENLKFVLSDITEEDLPLANVYILNDVLHYIPKEMQIKVLNQCMENVGDVGFIIVRDADTNLKSRTAVTKFTEIHSTRIVKFNKSKYKLSYFSGSEISEIAQNKGFVCERFDHAKLTSNITYIIRKQSNE